MIQKKHPKKYYTIGETAKFCDISIKTLRHYDAIGLLKPAYVNLDTNRRYYEEIQLYHLFMIKKLKGLKFSLEEIKKFSFQNHLDQMIPIFKQKLKSNQKEIQRLEKSNQDIENWMNLLKWLNDHKNIIEKLSEFSLKEIEERKIVYYRSKIPFIYSNLFQLAMDLNQIIDRNHFQEKGFYLYVFHDPIDVLTPKMMDIEIARMIEDNREEISEAVRIIPKGDYLCVTQKGGFVDSLETVKKFKTWADQNFYQIAGPILAIYIIPLAWVTDSKDLIIEYQVQVKKIT